jgi:hypothetical protein
MEINGTAPVVAHSELEIAADPTTVWDVLTTIAAWPSWNPDVKSASIEGKFAPGTQFRWKPGPSTIKSTVEQVEPPRRVAWTGKTLGIKAIHVHRLEARNGHTVVHSEESWEGMLPRLLRGSMQKTLQNGNDSGLQHLKTEAERRASPRPAAS